MPLISVLGWEGHSRALRDLGLLLTRYRELAWEMTKQEITHRYAGQALGVFWAIGHPLALIAVYVFVFSFVFGLRFAEVLDVPRDYTTYILAGLIPWMAFQESMNKGCGVILTNSRLVKQVVFPVQVLPLTVVLASLLTQLVATVVLFGYLLFTRTELPPTLALLPLLVVFQALAMAGVAYLLASVSVFFRDLREIVQVFGMIGLYLAPIFYQPSALEKLGPGFTLILWLNPFSYLVWCYQDVIYFGRLAHPVAWVVLPVFSVICFYSGYRVFRRLSHGFGSAL